MTPAIGKFVAPSAVFLLATTLVIARGRTQAPADQAREAAANAIQVENARPGTTDWMLTKAEPIAVNVRDDRYRRQRAIEGYVSHAGLRAGETLTAFVSAQPAASYRVDVYRLGYYDGMGGRLMTSIGPFQGSAQPEPIEGEQQLMEARWTPSFRLPIPADWPSGVYLGKITTEREGYQSYLIWVVRDDRHADLEHGAVDAAGLRQSSEQGLRAGRSARPAHHAEPAGADHSPMISRVLGSRVLGFSSSRLLVRNAPD
jgi:hypothetical protein